MLSIDCRFPGGNIKVHDIQGDTVFVSPDLRDTRTSWFYWAFRVCGVAGRTLVFRFLSDHPVGTRGPAVSTDGRRTWRWTNEAFDQDSFRTTIPADETYLCFAPLYTQENWDRFIADETVLAKNASNGFEPGFFAESRKGRPVEILHAGAPANKAARHVVFTARHHCCEMIADWTMEGIVSTVLDGDSADAAWLRENVSFSFVPFVDKDGVEDGDQGKNRAPHDPNRDYAAGHYASVRSFKRLLPEMAAGRKILFIDLHSPWSRTNEHEWYYSLGPDNPARPEIDARWRRFREELAKAVADGPLAYEPKWDIPGGVGYNQSSRMGTSSCAWCDTLPNTWCGFCMEFGYGLCGGVFTRERGRDLGRRCMRATVHTVCAD